MGRAGDRASRWAPRSIVAGVLAALLAGTAAIAGADPYRDVSLALGQSLVAMFPAAQGYVVSAEGGEAYIDLAEKDLMKSLTGAELIDAQR